MHHEYKSHAQAINQRNIIKFQALADFCVYFPYLVKAPLQFQEAFSRMRIHNKSLIPSEIHINKMNVVVCLL